MNINSMIIPGRMKIVEEIVIENLDGIQNTGGKIF